MFLLGACASTGGRPGWLDGRAEAYPPARYLTATADAAQAENAKTRALSNLAAIFEVRIEETARDETAAWRRSDESGVEQGSRQRTARSVDAYTTKLLEGARIAEIWRDPQSGRHHALAVMDRGRLVRRLSGEIRSADRYAQTMVARAGRREGPLDSARALWAARNALVRREMLQRDLQIADATGAGIRPLWSSNDLEARVDAQLERMRVGSRVSADPVGGLDEALQAGIAAAGMTPVAAGAGRVPAYRLNGTLDVRDVGRRDGWYWFRGALEIELVETGSGASRFSHRWPLKASGQSREQARVRLEDHIADRLQTRFKAALLNFGRDDEAE
jgi:hypothetical protein